MQAFVHAPARPWERRAIITIVSIILLLSVSDGYEAVGPVQRTTPWDDGLRVDEVDVVSIQLSFDDDVVVAKSHPTQETEVVVTGRVSLTGIPPNTQVDVEAEVDKGWETTTSPESYQYVMPQRYDVFDISVRVFVPAGVMAYTEGVLTVSVIVRSAVLPDNTVMDNVIVFVDSYHDVDVVWDTKKVECCQNESFKITGEVTNNGNGDETLAFLIERPFESVAYIVHYVDVAINETTDFAIRVDVPDNISLGVHYLEVYCFALGYLDLELVSSQEVEVKIVEDGESRAWVLYLGIAILVASLGVAFYILRTEKLRRTALMAPVPEALPSNRGS